jgi:hypothetical protein
MLRFLLIAGTALLPVAAYAGGVSGGSNVTSAQLNGKVSSAGGDSGATVVKASDDTANVTLSARLGAVVNVLGHKASCSGASNEYAAYAEAQSAGQSRGAAQIEIPPNCQINLGGQQVFTASGNAWHFGTGAKIVSGGIQGVLDQITTNNETWSKASSQQTNENILAEYLLANPSIGSAGYQKNAHYVRATTADPSTYTAGPATGTDAVTAARDLVGYEAQINAASGNNAARLYGYHSQLTFPSDGDGNGIVAELEMFNGASYTPQTGKQTSKTVIHPTCIGPKDCTAAIAADGNPGGSAGRFHIDYLAFGNSIRTDGYGFAQFPSSSGDLTQPPLWGVTQAGKAVANAGETVAGGLSADTASIPSVTTNTITFGGTSPNSVPSFVGTAPTFQAGLISTTGTYYGLLTASGGLQTPSTASVAFQGSFQARGGVVSAQTGAYTVAATDCGTVIRDNASAAHNITIPTGLPIGCRVGVIQIGTGAPTIIGASGVTVEAPSGAATAGAQFARLSAFVDSASTVSVGAGL